MGILEIIKDAEKQKKQWQKTFRLTESVALMLDGLSKSTELSQNEIVNSLLEDYRNEYNFIHILEVSMRALINYSKNKLILWSWKIVGNKSILYMYTLIYSDSKDIFECTFKIFSGKAPLVDFFEEGILIFEDMMSFTTHEDFMTRTGVNSKFESSLFRISDVDFRFTFRGIETK